MFADGGLYANSPDQLALHEAQYFLKQPLADIRIQYRYDDSKFLLLEQCGVGLGMERMDVGAAAHQRDDRIATAERGFHHETCSRGRVRSH